MAETKEKIIWVVVSAPGYEKVPEAARTSGVSEDGTLYVWTGIAGDAGMVSLCALHDGIDMYMDKGHAYVPDSWMIKQYPHLAELCGNIRKHVLEYVAKNPEA